MISPNLKDARPIPIGAKLNIVIDLEKENKRKGKKIRGKERKGKEGKKIRGEKRKERERKGRKERVRVRERND